MPKNITEKTFELNITSELINFSKSWIWELEGNVLLNLLQNDNVRKFLSDMVFYGEGLTQKDEKEYGYDVCIKCPAKYSQKNRLLFLQYKSGKLRKYSKREGSLFEQGNGDTEHIMFTFNNAADNSQHIKLRHFSAGQDDIAPNSIMYVFPRITDENDFTDNLGNLIWKSSFVAISEIDKQARNANIEILAGTAHKYRTSKDGSRSEINLLLLLFQYNNDFLAGLIAELISVQIERLINIFAHQKHFALELIEKITDSLKIFLNKALNREAFPDYEYIKVFFINRISEYNNRVKNAIEMNLKVPDAPSQYTTVIPEKGLGLNYSEKSMSFLQYQII